jgi:nicotinate-nucleotide adenylyltransferase
MRLGLFGGSFDPVHYGHLMLAECCREQAGLDEIWFLPAARPPHKPAADLSSAEARIDMLHLAVGGHTAFRVSLLEIDRGGVSYTVDTLAAIAAAEAGSELFLLLGADMLLDLPRWREPARILELATPLFTSRPQVPPPDCQVLAGLVPPQRLAQIATLRVEMPQMDLSSSEIRRRVAAGRTIRYWTPRAVEKYIETQGLYRGD